MLIYLYKEKWPVRVQEENKEKGGRVFRVNYESARAVPAVGADTENIKGKGKKSE